MPKIGNPIESVDKKCDRCGSKRIVKKTWTEKIKNDSGFMTLQHTLVVCTNKECQKAFEKVAADEAMKKEKIRLAKVARTQ